MNNEKFLIVFILIIITILITVNIFLPISTTHVTPVIPATDLVKKYDYNKLYDPLTNPTRRVDREQIHPYYMKRMIDIPSRGHPDNFIQMGILVRLSDNNNNSENNILKLFGRQIYPRSNKYEYYTMVNSGFDKIKIPLNIKQIELYDDDNVLIKEVNSEYKVTLYKLDQPRYYPNI